MHSGMVIEFCFTCGWIVLLCSFTPCIAQALMAVLIAQT